MATVYLATDLRLDRKVALKIMHAHLSGDGNFKERFIREARSAARLTDPHVVSVFDQGQDDDTAYLVMEYLPGITLRDLLTERTKLAPEQALDIIEPVLSGLAAAHSAGIVHRDIKPENVLLCDDGRIKIGDFGLARASSNATATGQALLGTIAYLSPELVTRGVADVRSDIYAVGIMLFEMLTGEQPFKGEQPVQIAYQHANDTVPPPSSLEESLPVELDELVLWATARDPEKRPKNAGALLSEMQDARRVLGSGSSATATIGFGATRVLPPQQPQETEILLRKTGATEVLRNDQQAPSTRAIAAASSRLSKNSKIRKRRGKILFSFVTLLAVLSGVTGWYFGPGPGGYVEIPNVQDWDPALAQSELEKLDLTVVRDQRWDYTTTEGHVSGTEPSSGERVQKGTEIRLFTSRGAEPLPLPALIGLSEAEALQAISRARFQAGEPHRQFSDTIDSGTVIAFEDSAGNTLEAEAEFPEQSVLRLVVSAGALPAVQGLTFEAAGSLLASQQLSAARGQEEYHDSVSEGLVIGYQHTEHPIRQGDEVRLVISKGPQPVVIPQVVGDFWVDAKRKLLAAGLRLDYPTALDQYEDIITVKKITPGQGTTVPKNTVIKVEF